MKIKCPILPLPLPLLLFLPLLLLTACSPSTEPSEESEKWIELFNGKDLSGWTPKFSGQALGENYLETFAARDSLLVVSYSNWDSLNNTFGHLFYQTPYSSYRIQAEYRFTGEQVAGGPGWAFANNGLMLHCQDPSTMSLDQDFPLSLEFQFLGVRSGAEAEAGMERPSGNLCTPGCHVELDGQLRTDHCLVGYTGPSVPVGDWVVAEAVVYGDSLIHHIVEGDTILTYNSPRIGGGLDGLDTARFAEGDALRSGYIAIQAESHPIEFRSIRLLPLSR